MYTQENRLLSIDTPLGKDELLLSRFSGFEGLSTLFYFDLEFISKNHNIVFKDIIGKNVTVAIELVDGSHRNINGIISKFCHQGGDQSDGKIHFSSYSAIMVPWFWLLTRTADSRIFQNLSVPEIAEKIFSDHEFSDFSLRLHDDYTPREYCVQYRETDFNFLSRLFEEEGIFYFFEHGEKRHTLVIADSSVEHKPCPQMEVAKYKYWESVKIEEDTLSSLMATKEIKPGQYMLNDYNHEMPTARLKLSVQAREQLGPGKRHVYDYPGEYTNCEEGERLVNIRMEEQEVQITTLAGSGNCRAFASGYRFKLENHFREELNNTEFVLTRIDIHAQQEGTYRTVAPGGSSIPASYMNQFECIPHEIPFRPARITPRPVVQGVQTAFVVGPKGEEIYTDELGRVKVQFHWDRRGEYDENSTCWIRVGQSMAGNRWGSIFLPRVNHEVIVDFLEGDPDRPIITGQVYHGNNLPPYALPEHDTITSFKSNSSPEGDGFNEIRFEDKKGEEQVFIHAEKNKDIRIKEDRLEWIGKDSHLIVLENQMEEVKGDKHLTVEGDHNEKTSGTFSMEAGADIQEKAGSNHALEAGQEIHLKAGMKVVIEAGLQISLKVGGNFVDIGPAGVTIQGTMVKINSGGAAGSGSGSSPAFPELPKEADTAIPGEKSLEAMASNEIELPVKPPPPSAQAQALKSAAESGKPFCEN